MLERCFFVLLGFSGDGLDKLQLFNLDSTFVHAEQDCHGTEFSVAKAESDYGVIRDPSSGGAVNFYFRDLASMCVLVPCLTSGLYYYKKHPLKLMP